MARWHRSVRSPVVRLGAVLLAGLIATATTPAITAQANRSRPSRPPSRPAVRPAPPVEAKPTAPPSDPDAIMPVKDLRPGMKGYGFTVFQGDRVERFDVTILGVLPKAYGGQDMVLIKMDGGPITARHAYLIRGMSGSPIYVDGKLVGAFSMGVSGDIPREPIGMVTPIEAMMEALDPRLDPEPVGIASAEVTVPAPLRAQVGGVPRLLIAPHAEDAPRLPATLRMVPLVTPVLASGLSRRGLQQLEEALRPWRMEVQAGGGDAPPRLPAQLRVGGSLSVVLMTGDIDISGLGTVTWIKGNQILGWGHPWFPAGAARFGIANGWVYDIFPAVGFSFKIGAPGEIVGTLDHDRPFSVAGRIGVPPPMVPITCHVVDASTGRSKTLRVKTVTHPLLMWQLGSLAAAEAIAQVRPVPGDTTATVKLTLEAEGIGRASCRERV